VTPTTPTTTPTSPTGSSGGGGGGGGQWCVASQSAAETTVKVALDYACGYGADCSQIQQGGVCFDPDTLRDHASYAFNDYYQKNPAPTSCVFGGVATLTNKDPSKILLFIKLMIIKDKRKSNQCFRCLKNMQNF
jgi:hypothetical protein